MIKIALPEDQCALLRKHLRRSGRREIGGVLMGEQIDIDHFRVVEFSVDDHSGSAAHFVRSPEAHQSALEKFFERTGSDYKRFNYLGEWHSHPSFSVNPSVEDVHSMQGLVNGERDIDFSALIVVRLRYFVALEAAAYMFIRNRAPEAVSLTRPAKVRWL